MKIMFADCSTWIRGGGENVAGKTKTRMDKRGRGMLESSLNEKADADAQSLSLSLSPDVFSGCYCAVL